jgi:hypothetical protein
VDDDPDRLGCRPARAPRPRPLPLRLFALARLAIDLTTSFRTWPLRLASLIGFIVMLLGLLALAFVLGQYVARIHHRVLREPAYVVRQRIGEPIGGMADVDA